MNNLTGLIEKLNKKCFSLKYKTKNYEILYNGHDFKNIKLYDVLNCDIVNEDSIYYLTNINYVIVGHSKKSIILSFVRCGVGNYKVSNKYYNSLCKKYGFSLKPRDSIFFNEKINEVIERKNKKDLYIWFNLGCSDPKMLFWKLEKDRIERQLLLLNLNVNIVNNLSREKHKVIEKIKDNPFKSCLFSKNIKYELCEKLKINLDEDVSKKTRIKKLAKLSRFLYKLYVDGYYYVEKSIIDDNFILPNNEKLFEFDIVYDDDLNCYYSIEAYNVEIGISNFVKNIITSENFDLTDNTSPIFLSKISQLNNKYEIFSNYNAFMSIFEENIVYITGDPGCGKTTLIKKLITIFMDYKVSYLAVSFTGKATNRLKREFHNIETEIYTLHSCLNKYQSSNPFKYLILDESSMISTKLFNKFIGRFNHDYKIIFVGDLKQLPCIDGVSILDVISKCDEIPKVVLEKNYRHDPETQNIFKDILSYHLTQKKIMFNQNVQLISQNVSCNQVIAEYHKIVKYYCMYDIKILTPYKKCVMNINSKIRDYYSLHNENENKGNVLKTGDFIMFMKNDYENNVFNGQEGIIINKDDKKCHVLINQNVRIFDTEYLNENVQYSYCITISKSQGDEWNVVIIYIPNSDDNHDFLNLNLLYTAISRCIKKVIIICEEDNFYRILENIEKVKCTNIPKRIKIKNF